MNRVSMGRVALFGLAGALAGFITWLVLNPSMSASEEQQRLGFGGAQDLSGLLSHVLLLGAMLGMTIGIALIAADELRTHNIPRIALTTLAGGIVGALCGMAGSIAGQVVFSTLLVPSAVAGGINPILLVIARTLGWAIIGAAAGLCPGAVSRSPRRAMQGAFGGAIGGGAGGLLFDLLGTMTQGGGVSRLIGFVLIGLLTGALVSLVEEFAKEFWITALTGSREGRSYILAKESTTLGRSELADIPLFGDLSVQKLHARLTKRNGAVVFTAEPGLMVAVNRQPVMGAPLSDGDILGLGGHHLRFNSRYVTTPTPTVTPESRLSYPIPDPLAVPAGAGYPVGAMTPPSGVGAVAFGLSHLEVIAGPHIGAVFPLSSGAIIGRDPRCDIPLVQDTSASRQHARLTPDPSGQGWRIEDGGSMNGTWVNGQRTTEQTLRPGDQIGVGQTLFQVR